MSINEFEVMVIGGGPAGLSAALYLGRYDRSVALFDTGRGRSTWHQTNHNYLGFPGGVRARELRRRGQRQLAEYAQVRVLEHKIEALSRRGDLFVATGQAGEWCARAVIVCTGVVDHYPHFDGWQTYVGRSMFWCITCDGYGCRDARVVVVGKTNAAASEALQLQRFTKRLTVITDSHECLIEDERIARLEAAGIPMICDKIQSVVGRRGQFEALLTMSGQRIELDQMFVQHGATPQTALAEDLGVALSAERFIVVDSEQNTSVPGVYAAGDVTVHHSHQVSAAVHEGGQAASAANYFLYPSELKD